MNKRIKTMSKRMRQAHEFLAKQDIHADGVKIEKAIELLKAMPGPKMKSAVEVVVKLGIDATKSDQNVRGAALMPSGMGRQMKIAVFAQGTYQKDAQAAGADYIIGDEANAKDFISGALDVDACVATPDIMATLLKWGVSKVLGPKGLMPNAKVGTVTFDVKNIVTSLKKGQAVFKNDKAGYLHASVGLLDFTAEQIKENLLAFVSGVAAAKPAVIKAGALAGFIQSVIISSTMCPAIKVNLHEFASVVTAE